MIQSWGIQSGRSGRSVMGSTPQGHPGRLLALKTLGVVLLTGTVLSVFAPLVQAKEALNLQDLLHDTQSIDQTAETMTVVWWIPNEFWQASLEQDGTLKPEEIQNFIAILQPYTLVAVVSGEMTPNGAQFADEAAIREGIVLKDAQNRSYAPLKEAAIDPQAVGILQTLRPMLATIMGQLGSSFHFILFPGKTQDGQALADAKGEGKFVVEFKGKAFPYLLPLGSVLPPQYDPKTGQQFPGNYRYNPFTGSPLSPLNR